MDNNEKLQGFVINDLSQFEETYEVILDELESKGYNVITVYGILEDIKRIVTDRVHKEMSDEE